MLFIACHLCDFRGGASKNLGSLMKLDHVQLAVPAGSEDICRDFWAGCVGLVEIAKPPALQARGGLWFDLEGAELHLGVEQDFHPARKAHPAFSIAGLDELAAKFKESRYPVSWAGDIAGRRRFFTEDPFGNRIEFLEYQTNKG